MKPSHLKVADLQAGDVILPPARELRLWMRRRVAEGTLAAGALRITVESVEPAEPDARGAWLRIRGVDAIGMCWSIMARPATPWPVLARA